MYETGYDLEQSCVYRRENQNEEDIDSKDQIFLRDVDTMKTFEIKVVEANNIESSSILKKSSR